MRTCIGGLSTLGVTDFVCAPWMWAVKPGTPDEEALPRRLDAVRRFAEQIVSKF